MPTVELQAEVPSIGQREYKGFAPCWQSTTILLAEAKTIAQAMTALHNQRTVRLLQFKRRVRMRQAMLLIEELCLAVCNVI